MIQTVDNFYLSALEKKTKAEIKSASGYYAYYDNNLKAKEQFLNITLKDYQDKKYPNNNFFSFFKDEEKKQLKNQDDLIISIKKSKNDKDEDIYLAQTGNYLGKFVWDGLEIDIKSRFSNVFLQRMLNFANDVFLDDVSVSGKETKELDIAKYIIYYMFVQNLEKAFLLGLPKSYRSVKHHEMKLKGKIDINRFIKHDIPFQGKVSSVSREQKEIQEIIDVLYKAVKIIDKSGFSTKNISHIKTHLKQHRSNKFVSNEMITKAMKSKALQNPIFSPYKKVLEYARFIINGNNLEQTAKDEKTKTYGFLINVAELFEIYVTKLLQKEFSEWSVSSPHLRLDDEFGKSYLYSRKLIPDIVMKNNDSNDVMVFDTKYKKMNFNIIQGNSVDVDRNDFFQINTYMSYYQNHPNNYDVKVGGLLYPIETKFDQKSCHSDNWFGNLNTAFVVDGIDLSSVDENSTIGDISAFEQSFIDRVQNYINKT
ncbi:MAG: hypothetical protein WA945_10870 [Arcobacteraceae bacterium]